MSGCDCYPHGPDEPCTCDGCGGCEQEALKILGNSPVAKWFGSKGHVLGCTCDINWDCTSYDPCAARAASERESAP